MSLKVVLKILTLKVSCIITPKPLDFNTITHALYIQDVLLQSLQCQALVADTIDIDPPRELINELYSVSRSS